MYTDEDLEQATRKGIFRSADVQAFRQMVEQQRHSPSVDEENIRLISSFNDIFVVIAISLFLYSISLLGDAYAPALGSAMVAAASWLLAEFFVRRRHMALPAIVLVAYFAGSLFSAVMLTFETLHQNAVLLAAAVTVAGTFCHWQRFRVPITIAAGAVPAVIFLFSGLVSLFPRLQNLNYLDEAALIAGLILFAMALWWDRQDLARTKRQSDIAFWLHLCASPLIVHAAFYNLIIAPTAGAHIASFIALYALLTVLSLIIDRRAFMVSALVYVLYATVDFMDTYGGVENSAALVGIAVGFSLLILSGFWHVARQQVLRLLPEAIRSRVPR
ncbi:hypothetical protein [Marinomonas ostreistagni]|uniref:hypothetical protein n=1 Tax=Marinomonas ostreistagni TaxID=359209 RepID=UPI00194EB68C|nr:hypothetical protein [Marinomonas ostreistagni]MBM6550730.1 hypothetical protein [Marinomonas ostreistagni]